MNWTWRLVVLRWSVFGIAREVDYIWPRPHEHGSRRGSDRSKVPPRSTV